MNALRSIGGIAEPEGRLGVVVSRGPDPFDPPEDWTEDQPWNPTPPALTLAAEVVYPEPEPEEEFRTFDLVKPELGWRVRNWFRMLFSGEHFVGIAIWLICACRSKAMKRVPIFGKMIAGSLGSLMVGKAELWGTVIRGNKLDRRLLGRHLVVTAGKNYLAACMDNTSEPENLKYHAFGTGTNAAAAGDTALQTELTTQYATDNTRPTGSQAHLNATYTTVGTLSPDSAVAITEWGLLTQAAVAGGTMLDRQVFAAVNLAASADSLTTTYVLTFS